MPRPCAIARSNWVGVRRGLISQITGRESPTRSMSARDKVVLPDPISPTSTASSFSSTAYSSRASASACCGLSYRKLGSGVFPNGLVVKPKKFSNIGRCARLSRASAEGLDQRGDVNHQHDLLFADFGRAGDAGSSLQTLADGFDNDLVLPDDRVDDDARQLLTRSRHDHEQFPVRSVVAR